MKLESLVIANQHVAVNTFSGLVHTARQTMGVGNARSRWHNPSGKAETGGAWLSSARVVRCWVKSRNERNPCELLPWRRESPALCSDCPVQRGGRWGRRQVSMALTARAAHVLQCPAQNDPKPQGGGNLKSRAQFGLEAATRLHEAGIASNGTSATVP